MTLSLAIVIGINTVNIILLMIVVRYRNRELHPFLVWVFAGSIVFLMLWSLTNYLADISHNSVEALFWTRATFPAAFCMGLFVYLFSHIFPVRRGGVLFPVVYAVMTFLFSIVAFQPALIQSVTLDPVIGVSGVVVGPGYLGAVCLYLAFIGHASYNFIESYRRLIGKEKSQVFFVLIGWATFLSIAVMTNAILPMLTGNAHWSKFGPLGSIIMVSCISYAIIRHKFLNVKVIIQRGLVYSTLLTLIIALYLTLLFFAHLVFQGTNVMSITVSAFITTLVGIFGVSPLTQYFKRVTAQIFFRGGYDYASVLESLAEILNTHIVQDSIVKKTTHILEASLTTKRIAFLFPPRDTVAPEWSVVAIPLRSHKKHIGVLHLSKKRSGEAYTDDDMRLLKTFVDSAGTALEKAALYQQVKEHAEMLERKVEERTTEIRAIQKDQESMMLEISHGLQTPLTIMKGELFFLKKQGYETEKIEAIDTSIDRISFFITKLLSVYRLESAVLTEPVSFNLSTLLTRLVTSFRESVKGSAQVIAVEVEEDVYVVGDEHTIEEACANLIGNAMKYTHPERINTITVTLCREGNTAHLCVRDTGIGIRSEHIPHLFTKFYRVKEHETKHIQGTGLGLAVVKKIVTMHGGAVSLTSEYGVGTTIQIILPLTR